MRARIVGTGRSTPARVLTNRDLEGMVDTSDAWITDRTGIRERRILEQDRASSDLAAEAGLRACQAAGVAPSAIDCVIVATVTPDMPLPACAVFVQQKLGAAPQCPAFDLAAACAGFIYGLSLGDALIRAGRYRRVLVCGVEVLSRVVDWTDRNTCVLFGDAAGAVVLAPGDDERGILSTHLFADGAAWEHLNIPAGGTRSPASHETVDARQHLIKMNGREVYRLAVRHIAAASRAALEANGVTTAEVDWVIAHQANLRILEGVSQRCGVPMAKFFLNIDKYGNTSSASIPVALDEAVEQGKLRPGQLVLMSALGAGVAWGSALIRW